MDIIYQPKDMQDWSNAKRQQGKTIAFVPTMGFLHEGHASLLKEGRKRADELVLSIFVNPTQFAQGEDFDVYPRDMERDLDIANQTKVDVVFVPDTQFLYPKYYQTFVTLNNLPNYLCGKNRPTHFKGVSTIVAKLFNMVKPHIALFGQKDFQQLTIIQQMTYDLNFDIDIIGCPIIREKDGLAMSSRNSYLSKHDRQIAPCLYQALKTARNQVASGERDTQKIIAGAKQMIESHPNVVIDYISIFNSNTLDEINTISSSCRMALAVQLGKTRLIDNIELKI